MSFLMSLLIGVLFGTGVYLLQRRNFVRMLLGLSLVGNGANLLIFTAIGLTRSRAPIVPDGSSVPKAPFADPVAQALILTAIVISFAVIAFSLALTARTYEETGTDSSDDLRSTDE